MSASQKSDFPSPSLAERVDAACDRFEAAWKAEEKPRIENFLAGLSGQDQTALLHELLVLELGCRQQSGEEPAFEEYRQRFPEHDSVVRDAFAKVSPCPPTVSEGTVGSGPAHLAAGEGEPTLGFSPDRSSPAGYEVLEKLGRGGMGVVYKARQQGLNRLVALKFILAGPDARADEVSRFRREAEAAAGLRHANIVQIHEIGEHAGLPYFSLEYVEGGTLAQQIAGVPQPAHKSAQLVETLARAMHVAHQSGIVHRDLKPANVLLTADGSPKIADFGLAKRLAGDPGLTRSGIPIGTPVTWRRSRPAASSRPSARPRTSTRWERFCTNC